MPFSGLVSLSDKDPVPLPGTMGSTAPHSGLTQALGFFKGQNRDPVRHNQEAMPQECSGKCCFPGAGCTCQDHGIHSSNPVGILFGGRGFLILFLFLLFLFCKSPPAGPYWSLAFQ